MDDEILSAELVHSDAAVLAEFQACYEEVAETPDNSPHDLQQAAKALISVLSRCVGNSEKCENSET
jgi:hypothetical protein